MLWTTRRRKKGVFVYPSGADSNPNGKAIGCYPTQEEADAQIAQIVENHKSEMDVVFGLQKASTDSAFITLSLSGDWYAERIHDALYTLYRNHDVRWQGSYSLHVTLIYCVSITNEQLFNAAAAVADLPLPYINFKGIGVFENDRKVVHIVVEKTEPLMALHRTLYDALAGMGVEMSPLSSPNAYTPHITMGYFAPDIEVQNFEINEQTLPRCLDLSRDEYSVVGTVYLRPDYSVTSPEANMMEMKAQVLAKSVSYNEDGDLVIPVVGIPFTGPINGIRDLSGDFFHKNTDTGPLETWVADFDHGLDQTYMKKELKAMGYDSEMIKSLGDIGFGKQEIGIAEKGETTADGIIYNVIVNRRHRYIKALEKAAKQGLIDASSRALSRIDDPEVPGKIDYWQGVALALTPTPMNPDAKNLLMKSIVEEYEMTKKTEQEVTTPVEGEVETPVAEEPVTPITDKVREKLNKSAAKAENEEQPVDPTIVDMLKAMLEGQTRLEQALVTFQEGMTAEIGTVKSELGGLQKNVSDFRIDVETALPELAGMLAEDLKGEVHNATHKSKFELDAETNKRQQQPSRIPQKASTRDWPGSSRSKG